MQNELNRFSGFDSDFSSDREDADSLLKYVQALNPEAVAHLSRPNSPEVMKMMERNVVGLLGGLPSEQFDVTVTTSRENLGRLLASAMMSGYFLRNVEQRMAFEQSLQASHQGSLGGSESSRSS